MEIINSEHFAATLKKPAHNWWTKITRESAGASERLRREDYKIYLYKKNELHTSATDGRQQLFLSGSLHMYAVSHSLVNASWNVSAKAAASASWRTKLKLEIKFHETIQNLQNVVQIKTKDSMAMSQRVCLWLPVEILPAATMANSKLRALQNCAPRTPQPKKVWEAATLCFNGEMSFVMAGKEMDDAAAHAWACSNPANAPQPLPLRLRHPHPASLRPSISLAQLLPNPAFPRPSFSLAQHLSGSASLWSFGS